MSTTTPDGRPKLPTFLNIGAAKAGTTALAAWLEQHPEIYFTPFKEPMFFAREGMELDFAGPGDLSLTPTARTNITGEISSRISADRTMSLMRLISRLVPVNGVSHMPTIGMPPTSCSRPWMMLMPNTSGTK